MRVALSCIMMLLWFKATDEEKERPILNIDLIFLSVMLYIQNVLVGEIYLKSF